MFSLPAGQGIKSLRSNRPQQRRNAVKAGPSKMTKQHSIRARTGAYTGRLSADERVGLFKGIAYAQPPVGPRRWRPPIPVPASAANKDAFEFAAAAQQIPYPEQAAFYRDDLPVLSEDCLYLNIWTPVACERAPVLMWIHGGALTNGSGASPLYDGESLARDGVVVVTINYRLGVFGYYSHPDLTKESPHNSSGNYGTLDQICALQWIRENIAAFGGDPERVTIAGQSAGALSVVLLMTSPLAHGLFQAAIAQSPYLPCLPNLSHATLGQPSAEETGLAFAARLGAATVGELRQLGADELMTCWSERWLGTEAVVDGWVQPRQLFEAFEENYQAPVALVAGFTSNEASTLGRMAFNPALSDPEDYCAWIERIYGDLAQDYLSLYPPEHPRASSIASWRDANYGWAAAKLCIDHNRHGHPAFLYLFDQASEGAIDQGLGAFHSSDVPYVFGTIGYRAFTPPHWPSAPQAPEDFATADAVRRYWHALASGSATSGYAETLWAPFDSASATLMRFRNGARPEQGTLEAMFELHDAIISRRRAAGQFWNSTNLATDAPDASTC